MSSFPKNYETGPTTLSPEFARKDIMRLIKIVTDFFDNKTEIQRWLEILQDNLTADGIKFLNSFELENQEIAAFVHSLSDEDRQLLMYGKIGDVRILHNLRGGTSLYKTLLELGYLKSKEKTKIRNNIYEYNFKS